MRRHAPRKIYTRHLGVCGATRVLPHRTICISHNPNNAQCVPPVAYTASSHIYCSLSETRIMHGYNASRGEYAFVRDNSLSETNGWAEDPLPRARGSMNDVSNKRISRLECLKMAAAASRLEILAASNRKRDEAGIPFGLNRIH